MKSLNDFLGKLPSTNARIGATIVAMLMTTLTYMTTGVLYSFAVVPKVWTPSVSWLSFMLGMAGVDTAHFFAKRKTDKRPDDAPPATTPSEGATP